MQSKSRITGKFMTSNYAQRVFWQQNSRDKRKKWLMIVIQN